MKRQFCKLFGPPADQVLVMQDIDGEGAPRVRVIFQDEDGVPASASSLFDPNTSGLLAARLHFDAISETSARHIVTRARIHLKEIARHEPPAETDPA